MLRIVVYLSWLYLLFYGLHIGQRSGDIFMQGDDAEQFISVETISNRCKRLNFDIIELALAKPYIDYLEIK